MNKNKLIFSITLLIASSTSNLAQNRPRLQPTPIQASPSSKLSSNRDSKHSILARSEFKDQATRQLIDTMYFDFNFNDNQKGNIEYDEYGNIIMYTHQKINSWNNSWEKDYRYIFIYNNAGEIQFEITLDWKNPSNSWDTVYRHEHSYNSNGMLTSSVVSNYSNSTGWTYESQILYEYDLENNLMVEIFQVYNQEWKNLLKDEYSYDNNRNISKKKNYVWLSQEEKWELRVIYEHKYSNDKIILLYEYHFFQDDTSWSNTKKTEYSYTLDNLILETKYKAHSDNSANRWYLFSKTENEYDNFNNLTQTISYLYEDLTWINSRMTSYAYDHSVNLDDIIFTTWEPSTYAVHSKPLGYSDYSWNNGNWNQTSSTSYYYIEQDISLYDNSDIKNNIDVTIFPNPTTDYILLTTNANLSNLIYFELFDIQGKNIIPKMILKSQQTLDLSNLGNGIYVYKLMSSDKTRQGKLIKE